MEDSGYRSNSNSNASVSRGSSLVVVSRSEIDLRLD